ncbi:MAG: hypothetical protein QOE53_1811 [Pseudonocardiales bacterium]|nr:hypothetical protein [Pseudonocardiales bacterium]
MTLRGGLDRLRIKPGWVIPGIVFGWAQLVLLGWWAGQWPGLLSPDSVRYVIHVTTGPWNADHSVLYDSAVLASITLTRNIALLTLLQTTAAAAAIAYTVASLRAVGVRGRWAAIPGCVLPLLPSFGAFVTTVWKDVPFALCELLLTATVLRLFARRHPTEAYRRVPRRLLVALGFELLGLVLFRNDGFLLVLVIAVVLAVAFRGVRVAVLGIAAAAILASFFAQAVIYPSFDIMPANSSLAYGIFDADIALAYAQAPATFTESDRELLQRVAPLAAWRSANNCYTSDPLFSTKGFSLVRADKYHVELFALWRRVLQRTPVTVIRGRLCRSSVAWNVLPPPADKARLGKVTLQVPGNLYGRDRILPADIAANLKPQPLNHSLDQLTHKLKVKTSGTGYQWLLWRGATWCYVAYLVLLVAALRLRRWDLLAAGAASLANQLTVLAANPAQLYRYMAGPVFVGILLLALLAVRRPPPARPAEQAAAVDGRPAEPEGVPAAEAPGGLTAAVAPS